MHVVDELDPEDPDRQQTPTPDADDGAEADDDAEQQDDGGE